MKVLWISNHPAAPSGYGTQTRQVVRRLAADGHEVELIANDGIRGDGIWEGHIVRGSGGDRYSRDTLRTDIERSGADWVVSLYDAWVYGAGGPFTGLSNVAGWVPVDHCPAIPGIVPWVREHASIAMSRFGLARLEEMAGLMRQDGQHPGAVLYAPHAIDRGIYFPDPDAGAAARARHGIPAGAPLIGIVAANTGTALTDRKSFGDMFMALGIVLGAHPEAHAYIHTGIRGYESMDLGLLAEAKQLPTDRLHWADQHDYVKRSFTDDDMRGIYSAMDVLLGTSRGEGFGLPHLEAQACGVPVILSNWSASAELVGEPFDFERMDRFERHPSGWLVPVLPEWDPAQLADLAKPVLPAIVQALEEALAVASDPELRATYRGAAVARAALWDADLVYDRHWRSIVAAAGAAAPMEARPANRAARRQMARVAS